jgi:hypothetical protein
MDNQQLEKILEPWIAKWKAQEELYCAIAKILALQPPLSGPSIRRRWRRRFMPGGF